MRFLTTAALCCISLAFLTMPAAAQDFVPEAGVEDLGDEAIGWAGTLNAGGNFSLNSNRRVVGQNDGVAITLGSNIAGRLYYNDGPHQLRNSLRANQSFSRTASIDEFVKSADELRLESIYYYRIPGIDWLGPFARVQLNTALFKGFDVRADEVTYLVDLGDDSIATVTDDRLLLTDPFRPLILRESLGMFARPISETEISLDIRLGGGARQVFADGQLTVRDDEDTETIEVVSLRSYNQVGAELATEAVGSFEGGRVTYSVEGEIMVPFYDSVNDGEDTAFELANIELGAVLSFQLFEWASLNYEFRAARIPQLVDDWQVSNLLLLNLRYAAAFGYLAD